MPLRNVRRFAFVMLAIAAGCTKPAPVEKPCCEQPKIPAGVPQFTVVKDDQIGQSDSKKVTIRVVLKDKVRRDGIYPAMHVLYRHVMTRGAFEPVSFVGEFYASEAAANDGNAPLARIYRDRGDKGPKCDNDIKREFKEQVDWAFAHSTSSAEPEDANDTCHLSDKKKAVRIDEKFTHKTSYKVDEANKGVEVTYYYIAIDQGKDEYVPTLTFNSAMTYWAEFMTSMFKNSQDLKEFNFVGMWNDEPVLKTKVPREVFEAKLSSLQETIAGFAAITFQKLGMHKLDDKGAFKEQEANKTKNYNTALGFLPKGTVFVSPKLKKN